MLLVVALWGGIFLPGLGSTEMKGEEARRVMPAITMLEGGSWLVPYVAGKPFLRKPPLVQWCIAGSLKVFGHNTWAARLPSALSVLALALVMVFATRRWLIAEQSLLAAVIMMAQVATIEKCRLAELEAVYVSLSGIALVLWMSWWVQGRSPWLTWTVPFIFNGLALLAKAPLHLLFFYAVVAATLALSGEFRSLWKLPHLAGIALMAGLLAAWAIPCFIEVSVREAGSVWKSQFVDRVTGATTDSLKLALNLPKGLVNHLPWVLFAPVLWQRGATASLPPREEALLKGGRLAVSGCFVVLLLIPGVLPRYVQPLVTPFSLLLAPVIWRMPDVLCRRWRHVLIGATATVALGVIASPFVAVKAVAHGAQVMSAGAAGLVALGVSCCALALFYVCHRLHEIVRLTLWTGSIAVLVMVLYACVAVPWLRLREKARPFAARIDEALADGGPLIAYRLFEDAPLLATLFYLRAPFRYAAHFRDAPAGEHHYLVPWYYRKEFNRRFRIIGESEASHATGGTPPSVVIRAERLD